MNTFINVVECAIEHNGAFLVIQHPPHKDAADLWAFPGGKIDHEDTLNTYDVLRTATQREVFEETGITLLDPLEYVLSTAFTTPKGIHVFNVTFYCNLKNTQPIVNIPKHEIAAHAWMTPHEIEHNTQSAPWLKEYIKRIETYKASK